MAEAGSGLVSSASSTAGRLERSGARFVAFFRELQEAFVERDDILQQIALALLGREHVLLTGPPGTAKSQLARSVLGRILDAKTGEPSLFARQFTENTVLTDLVGAIDFKTLMETGRSEHFTDDGIMGSVHAFLDEVFDGRDMLLRSTLNLLGERELKEGKRTTRGRVECSLMTTNRYLAEVLEESRESLLAFVDRIAFVGFVPKGFADEASMRKVMRQSLGQARPLRAYLTIQDVDVLQDAVDLVRVPPEASDRLVEFLGIFEAEMAAEVRARPDFSPSRYLSTRTRVRAGKLLKSIALYGKLFVDPSRPLAVTLNDFEALRLVLLQSGPPRELAERLAKEQDPREARQLKIVHTERDVFERSLARLDRTPWHDAPAQAPLDPAAWNGHSLDELLALLERSSDGSVAELSLSELSQLILRRTIEQGLDTQAEGVEHFEQTTRLLDYVERTRGPTDPLVHWLRARSLLLLEGAIERVGLSLERLSETQRDSGVLAVIELLLPSVESLRAWAEEAERLCERTPQLSSRRAAELLETAAGSLANRLHAAFHAEISALWSKLSTQSALVEVALPRLRAALEALDAFAARAQAIHPACATLFDGVAHGALAPLAANVLSPLKDVGRAELMTTFDSIWAGLSASHVARYLPLDDVLVIVLKYAAKKDETFAASVSQEQKSGAGRDGYRALRQRMPRTPLAYVAVELCLRLDPTAVVEFAKAPRLELFAVRVARLPAELQRALWASDLARLDLTLQFFDAWLATASARKAASSELFLLLGELERDDVGLRLRLESELIEAILPEAADECVKLRARVDELSARVRLAAQARSASG
jgi:MoxR-like ATPase